MYNYMFGGVCMKYKIGDVAKILGISPDLLRYYQKKGVVTPTMGENNNYRYYDAWDINFLIDCLWFKNFGFGIEQTAKLVSQMDFDGILSDMEQKQTEIRESIRHQQMLLDRADQYFTAMHQVRQMVGQCNLVYAPECYRFLNRHNREYENIPELQDVSHRWLQYMPFVSRCFEIEQKDLQEKNDNYAWGFAMGMDFVEKLQVPLDPPVKHLPSVPSVHTAFTSSGKTGFSPRHLRHAMDYVRSLGLTVSGNVRGTLVCSAAEGDHLTGYFEVWIPVEPKDGLVFAPCRSTEASDHE